VSTLQKTLGVDDSMIAGISCILIFCSAFAATGNLQQDAEQAAAVHVSLFLSWTPFVTADLNQLWNNDLADPLRPGGHT
jgi:hypothetical protein